MKKALETFLDLIAASVLTVLLAGIITIPLALSIGYVTHTYSEAIKVDGDIDKFKNVKLMAPSNIVAVSENGEEHIIGVFYDQNRVLISPESIPDFLLKATIAAEDKNFYSHNGVNLESLFRAGVANYNNEGVVQGGSTITQQYVKNVLVQEAEWLADDVKNSAYAEAIKSSLSRKMNEMRYAIAIEKELSKEEIITNYLNIVGFGGQIYGITAAADYYYGKQVAQLTLDEAATLIGIINLPEKYRMDKPTSKENGESNGYAETKERRNYVIYQMFLLGYLNESDYLSLRNKPIKPNINKSITGCGITGWGDYACSYVLAEIQDNTFFGSNPDERLNNFRRGGYKVVSTFKPELMSEAKNIINMHVPKFDPKINIGSSIVTVESKTGNIIVMQQNTDYSATTKDDGVTSVNFSGDKKYGGSTGFPTGSTFKLFTLVEWVKNNKSLNASVTGLHNYTRMKNSCEESGFWRGNYTIYNSGQTAASLIARDPETGEPIINPETGQNVTLPPLTTSVMAATAASYNTIFMSMAAQLDLCSIAETAESLGHVRADGQKLMFDPAMVLGVNETAPIHVAQAYSVISNLGVKCETKSFTEVYDRTTGEKLYDNKNSCEEVIEENVATQVTTALARAASGTGANSNPKDGVAVAIKTGTSDDAHHTWVAGFTSETTTVVWVGNVEGYNSLNNFRYADIQGSQIRHSLFKKTQTIVNEMYGGAETWSSR
jgi:membrane peptidoglycan carboxypeptidase